MSIRQLFKKGSKKKKRKLRVLKNDLRNKVKKSFKKRYTGAEKKGGTAKGKYITDQKGRVIGFEKRVRDKHLDKKTGEPRYGYGDYNGEKIRNLGDAHEILEKKGIPIVPLKSVEGEIDILSGKRNANLYTVEPARPIETKEQVNRYKKQIEKIVEDAHKKGIGLEVGKGNFGVMKTKKGERVVLLDHHVFDFPKNQLKDRLRFAKKSLKKISES